MFAWLLVASCFSGASSAGAQNPAPAQQQIETKLQGLSPAEASLLIAKFQHAQEDLRAGKSETFELLAGAPASYPAARIAPRDAFLRMSFARPWSVERKPATGLWQPYELTYFLTGPRSLMWKVEVIVGQVDQLVRVEMLYTAPPPF